MSRKSSSSKSSNANDTNEKNSTAIREFQVGMAENKKCFECDQRGPTYVDMTIGSFVCTKCSGMLRGITPPHRIKSISMSSFSSDEVTFLKSRGNVWCSKVWMGLYDKNRSAALDSKDEDALKYHIIQKYEKKSYYVDPSQIQQTLSSIQSSNIPAVTASSSASSASTGGFIGTTLTQRVNSSNFSNNRPSAAAAPAIASAIPPSIPISKPVASKPNGAIPSSMSGIVLPPPVVDPFFSNANFPSTSASSVPFSSPAVVASAFGDVSFTASPSTTSSASKISQQPSAPTAVANAGTNSASKIANESFANFDAAQFDSVADPWASSTASSVASNNQSSSAVTPKSNMFSTSTTPLKPAGSAPVAMQSPSIMTNADKAGQAAPGGGEDKYSALKELDEIFKSTVVLSDGKSTGTSLFGTSPMQANPSPILSNAGYGPSPTGGNAGSSNGFDAGFWNDSKPNENRGQQGFSSPNWVPNWGNAGSASQPKAPINPFTGASNLTQLNTSPWPTTGTSPVANASNTNSSPWPPSMNVGPTNTMGSSTSTASPAGFGFGSQATSGFDATSQPSNDPFGAAPASNIQKTENTINNNDLFAKAPFGSEPVVGGPGIDNSTINALTQDIFGNAPSSPSGNMNMATQQQQDFNPWASPSTAQQTSIFSSASKPKSTNPFL